jgi:8-amino-7-oxononanoate synthase
VLGVPEVIETLVNTGRSFIFDTGLAPASAGAALGALRVLARQPGLPGLARQHAQQLAALAARSGLTVTQPSAAVVRIGLGDARLAVEARQICAAHGVWAGCFRPPSVPAGSSCLRLTARANLTRGDFTRAARALAAVGQHVQTASPVGRK